MSATTTTETTTPTTPPKATAKKARRKFTPAVRVRLSPELVQRNRAAGRLDATDGQEQEQEQEQEGTIKMEHAGMRLWPDELAEAKRMAEEDGRSAMGFLRNTYLRGLKLEKLERAARRDMQAAMEAAMEAAALRSARAAADAAVAAIANDATGACVAA